MPRDEPDIALSQPSADEIKTTTCYMCACRCGIRVHLKDGKVRYIDGNRDHPVNKGVICGKGAAGIMKHNSPSRLRAPLKRVGPRGSGEFAEISWDEALATATRLAGDVRAARPEQARLLHRPRPEPGADRLVRAAVRHAQLRRARRLLLGQHGGGRALHVRRLVLGVRRARLGAHPLFHAVRRRRGPRLEPDQDRARQAQGKGVKFVAVNPVRTGYGAIADEWIGIRPGTDGLFVGSLIHELMRAAEDRSRLSGALHQRAWLVIDDPGRADDGLFARDDDGKPLAFDRTSGDDRRCDARRHRARAGRRRSSSPTAAARGRPSR